MASQNENPQAGQPQLNDFGRVAHRFLQYGQNATNNLSNVFVEMTLQQWIRLIIVVGAYLLLRPYAVKYLGKRKVAEWEEEDAKEKAKISPNQLRGEKGPVELDDTDEEGEGTATDWGHGARVRQRRLVKQLLAANEKQNQELLDAESDDDDIAEFLED